MYIRYLNKSNFYIKYMQLYAMRQAIANLQMEDQDTDLLSLDRTQAMFNNVIAFENALSKNIEKIGPYDLIDIAADVNNGIYPKGFRKTQVEVKRATNFFPPSAKLVPQSIYTLFDNYHNIWVDRPIYEKEARLHIELVRIQPFEDGNKRSTRILTNVNLWRQNKAPIIIPGCETDKYFSFIDDYDILGLAEYFRGKSEEEFQVMLELYRSLNGDSLDSDPDPIMELKENDVKVYMMAKIIIDDMR